MPEILRDVALIAVFFDREAMPVDAKNGDGWLLRSYPTEIFWAPKNEHVASPQFAFQLARMDKLQTSIPADSFGYFGRGTGGADGGLFSIVILSVVSEANVVEGLLVS